MGEIRQNIITLRFIEIYESLINKRIVKTQTEFSNRIGTSSQNFYQVQKGVRNITIDQIVTLQENFKGVINPFYLLGFGSPLLEDGEIDIPIIAPKDVKSSNEPIGSYNSKQFSLIPLYNIDAAASPLTLFNDSKESIIAYLCLPGFKGCTGALYVFGDSMEPTYNSGDIIILKELKDKRLINFGQTYVIITNEDRYLKNIKKADKPEMIVLSSYNDYYQDWSIPIDSITSLYEVKGLVRKTSL